MENVLFALGPKGRYLFNAPKAWARHRLPNEVDDCWSGKSIKDFQCVAFGEQENNYILKWKRNDGESIVCWGDDCPIKLKKWLLDKNLEKLERDCTALEVILGPDQSFIAWTADSICWDSLPDGLEEALQGWLSPAGWKSGPPRLVALGACGAYFALSQYGAYAYCIPADSWPVLNKEFTSLEANKNFNWTSLEYFALATDEPERWVLVLSNSHVFGSNAGDGEDYRRVSRSFATPEVLKVYDAEQIQREKEAEEERVAAAAKKAQEDFELQVLYATWLSTCETAFALAPKTPLKKFPKIPDHVPGQCCEDSCSSYKKTSGLSICSHDFERLLRASGSYSKKWLMTQRRKWHPDQFGKLCDPLKRAELQLLSQEVFKLYGHLIDLED